MKKAHIFIHSVVFVHLKIPQPASPKHHLARPRPRVDAPLAMPLGRGIPPPRPVGAPPPPRFFGAGVENLDDGFELAGGFSTKDVSVVLSPVASASATSF
jgi:hypothetical protein